MSTKPMFDEFAASAQAEKYWSDIKEESSLWGFIDGARWQFTQLQSEIERKDAEIASLLKSNQREFQNTHIKKLQDLFDKTNEALEAERAKNAIYQAVIESIEQYGKAMNDRTILVAVEVLRERLDALSKGGENE